MYPLKVIKNASFSFSSLYSFGAWTDNMDNMVVFMNLSLILIFHIFSFIGTNSIELFLIFLFIKKSYSK